MAEFKGEEYKFPDEIDADPTENKVEIEIEDDTPEADKGRQAVSADDVKKLEVETDELDQYSKDAKDKLIKMKRVWHDERRAKESAMREHQEALTLAQKLMAENKRIKDMLEAGSEDYKEAKKDSAKAAVKAAKDAYRKAYDAGDVEKIVEAQEELTKAQFDLEKAKKFKLPPLQEEKFEVQTQYQAPQPVSQPDRKVMEWQSNNPWFGQDEEMTAAALGLHEKMKRQGTVIGSDEYYDTLDKTIRKRFPENFGQEIDDEPKTEVKVKAEARTKPSTVVAPATRSTAPNRIRLKQSQVLLAKKLGLTPEQYALELKKLEALNG